MPPKATRNRFSVVLVTCPADVAWRIARAVLERRAAACVNILPGVKSLYRWKGRLEEADECLLVMKTRVSLLEELERVVRSAHPYEVPEVIALPIIRGHHPYLDWIEESTKA